VTNPIALYIDADACPVKDEIYKVAGRYGLKTYVVCNAFIRVPTSAAIELVVVDAGPDVADDWIAERVQPGDICITNDIPLAERCLQAGASAIGSKGDPFTKDSIGMAIAQRSLMDQLRSSGEFTGGPRPFSPKDRSQFLQALDQEVNRSLRRRR
jgi:uncharacterized protein YaiI (UPF0178 family)